MTSVEGDAANFDVQVDERARAERPHGSAGCAAWRTRADLLVTDAELVATVDDARREIAGGWVAVTGGVISGVGGPADPRPAPSARSTPAAAW